MRQFQSCWVLLVGAGDRVCSYVLARQTYTALRDRSDRAAGLMAGVMTVVMLMAGAASASHYRLVDVPDVIPERYHSALKSVSIDDTKVLYERIVTKAGRREVAKSTRVMFATLSKWASFLDLMQLDGVGPKMVRLLNAVGVKTLADFQSQVGATLQPKMRAANRGARYSEIVPSVGVVQGWIDLAKGVAVRLE